MTKRAERVWELITIGVCAAVFLGGGLTSAQGSEPDPAPDPKLGEAAESSLPADITGDALLSAERDRLRDALRPLLDFDGGMIWDPASKVLAVQMTSAAAVDQAREIISAAGTTLQVDFVQVQYSANELNDLANQLLRNQLEWAGATGIGGGWDPKTNRVNLQVDPGYKDAAALISAIERLEDPRVTLQYIEPVKGWAPENRVDDHAPWTVGAAIDGAQGGCTLGWTWRRWGSNQIVGSTARHCINLTWYNSGTYVGTVFQSSKPADSALMSGTTYSPTVFVGSSTTSDLRRVVAVDTSWGPGDTVAMSGRTTGLNVTTVKNPTYTLPSCGLDDAGLEGVLMQSHVTANGDSGGPWLTTQSGTGYAVAHGQHFGHGCATGDTGSFFVPLNRISSFQSVSILLF